jgi:hypothetical protein
MSGYQTLFQCAIYSINGTTTAKYEMLDHCQNYFVDNAAHLNVIQAFGRDYQPTMAAHWYTKDSFVHRIVNKALRLGNIEECCSLRFYIADLSMHLYQLKQQQLKTNIFETGITVLYRGLRQSDAQLEIVRNRVGHVIAAKDFMSTSRNREIALLFCSASHPQSSHSQAVLLELYVDMKSPVVIAADISHLSSFPEECEVLFDIGTRFHVDALTYLSSDAMWSCQLTAVTDESQFFKVQREINLPPSEIDVCPSTYSKYEAKLERIMRRERRDKFKIHRNYRKHDFLWRNIPPVAWVASSSRDLARIMMHRALVGWHRTQDVHQYYIECRRAWQLFKEEGNNTFFELKDESNILNTLGCTILRLGNVERAIKLLERALRMRERLGSSKYIIALTLRNLGLAYAFVDRPQDAFACFTKAIAIEKQVSSNYQWSTSMTLRSFGLFFHMQGNYNQAIEYLSKAWSEYLKCSELYTEHV